MNISLYCKFLLVHLLFILSSPISAAYAISIYIISFIYTGSLFLFSIGLICELLFLKIVYDEKNWRNN